MESPEVTFTLAYLVFAVCFVFTPNEFQSMGLTVQNLLSGWLGSEDMFFIHYHIRRSTATMLAHCFIPLGYYIGMCKAAPERELYNLYTASASVKVLAFFAIIVPTIASILAFYWSRKLWSHHPIAKTLAHYSLPQSSWRAVASSINTEFRRIDKFATGAPGARVIVTDTWVMKVTTYTVHVAQQQDIHLTVIDTRLQELPLEYSTPTQFITITVASVNPNISAFNIRLNSSEYGELKEKVRAPIRNAANVVIHQTLSDLFLETFRSEIEKNGFYHLPSEQELEPCIGCMQTNANIKLMKRCNAFNEGECQQCYCRPMWCLTCMGKWFASRQDQIHPETWLSSCAPCPTCRAKFCIVDVCRTQ
ncbi:E3 ubiquitin-protein ligase TM129 [Pelobates fuscus]|uniref:E3 ubiquitin-protein ligase TM129 n=1 Tax=Pelobates fuscus TaxID=191477 RepID=UPI002FE4724E